MRLLIVLLLFLNASFSQDLVLVCKGPYAYAYHRYQCSGLKHCKSVIVKVSMHEAIRLKRTPCEVCYPGAVTPSRVVGSSSVAPSSGVVSSGQCSATTKKGTRCSRSARSGGYCWQHGG